MPLAIEADKASPGMPPLNEAVLERYLAGIGLRKARVHVSGDAALIAGDPRDLWRVVARRDEVLRRLSLAGFSRIAVELDGNLSDVPAPH